MIAVALAAIFIGLVLGFFIPPYGFIAAGIGLVLFVVWLVGAARKSSTPEA